MTILRVDNLKVYYPIKGGVLGRTIDYVRAVDDISFELKAGETYGLVGESGSGKSTTGKSIMRLEKVTSGQILFQDQDIAKLNGKKMLDIRQDLQMIFQDPYSSLNPKKQVADIIAEPLKNYFKLSKSELEDKIAYYLEKVRLSPDAMYKYPHQFSGGQRQRIGIARALTLNPKLIIADEPVSALDVSVQAQVLNFLKELQAEMNLTYLFIGHDLGVIRHMCDRVGVMYRGRMVEEGTSEDILMDAQHIYTKRLVSSIPDARPENREEKQKLREEVKKEYESKFNQYFDENSRAYDLKNVSATHRVALPEGRDK
ncbi:MAG: ABC transporter ATP-binding protein [Bacilli bacterium]